MGRIRNVVFGALVTVVSFCVIAYLTLGAAGVFEVTKKSVLEGRTYQGFPELTVGGIAKGETQSKLEDFVADHVPARDVVMLGNAAIQRCAIGIANIVFGYSGYSTFFGSDYAYLPVNQAVLEKPRARSASDSERMEKAARAYSSLVESFPDVNWAFCMPDRATTSTASPLYGLCANVADYDYYAAGITDKIPPCTVEV